MDQRLIFDLDLIRRYDKSGPRYTSYPTAVKFDESFGEASRKQPLSPLNRPIILYTYSALTMFLLRRHLF